MTQPQRISQIPQPLPVLQPGVTISLLRRVWFATPANRRHQRSTFLDSIVAVTSADGFAEAKPLIDLSLAEVEARIGAVAPRFVVRFYDPRRKGVQVATFVERSDADTFAAGKQLYAKPAVVRELGKGLV
jgi:hypothetical protein